MLFYSNQAVDYHTLLKVAQANFALGDIRVYNANDGYVVAFVNGVDDANEIYQRKLKEIIYG